MAVEKQAAEAQQPEAEKAQPRLDKIKLRTSNKWESPLADAQEWRARIAEVLLSENLVVLSGLGTSLCVMSEENEERLAPLMSDLWTKVSQIPNFEEVRAQVGYPPDQANIEDLMSRCQLFMALQQDDKVAEFVKLAESSIQQACSFAKAGRSLPVHESFLRKVARRSSRQPRLRLFTTNYDRCFEVAAANSGFVVVDGFSHTTPQSFDGSYFSYDFVRRDYDAEGLAFIPNVFHLLKLHGSVDWERQKDGVVVRKETDSPTMVYPRVGKFETSYQQPYFELMSRFQSALRQPNTGLLVIGYGFNDKHLNEPILSALRANVGMKCVIVDPALPASKNEVHERFMELVDGGDVRLTAVASKFEDFVECMPDLVSLSEQEIHQARTRKLLGL